MKTTKIEELRKKFANEKINLVDLIKYFDTTKDRKLTGLLTEHILAEVSKINGDFIDYDVCRHLQIEEEELSVLRKNPILTSVINTLFYRIGGDNFYYIDRFRKYWDENKLSHDMTQYKSFEDIKAVVNMLDIKEFTKNNSLQIHKVFEDDTWLIVVPLSIKASQLYGAGTKWCTASRSDKCQYFENTQRSLLLYIINKVDNRKYAYQKLAEWCNEPGQKVSQFYNAADLLVDSVDLDIPVPILDKIREFTATCGFDRNSSFPDYAMAEWISFQAKLDNAKCVEVPRIDIIQRMEVEQPLDAQARDNIANLMEQPMEPDDAITADRPLQVLGRTIAAPVPMGMAQRG